LKPTNIFALGALALLAALAVISQADALQSTRAYKIINITVNVTPSPAPVVYHHAAPAKPAAAPAAQFARLVADPSRGPVQVASLGSAWDVAPGGPIYIAQSSAQATPVPVQFNAKPDPNSLYIKVIQHTGQIDAPYGTTTFPCVFEIYTYYTTIHQLTDWAYGTKLSGGPPPTFPLENYPTVSYLSWAVPDFGPAFTAYANSGAPGQKTWTGTAGQAQQHCIDLTITVPNSLPPSSPTNLYSATMQYNLLVN
jgi:hypothetical protein